VCVTERERERERMLAVCAKSAMVRFLLLTINPSAHNTFIRFKRLNQIAMKQKKYSVCVCECVCVSVVLCSNNYCCGVGRP